eukprot:sb/3472947/
MGLKITHLTFTHKVSVAAAAAARGENHRLRGRNNLLSSCIRIPFFALFDKTNHSTVLHCCSLAGRSPAKVTHTLCVLNLMAVRRQYENSEMIGQYQKRSGVEIAIGVLKSDFLKLSPPGWRASFYLRVGILFWLPRLCFLANLVKPKFYGLPKLCSFQ